MRKKFMLVAALAGILSLGACVDDKESASVEDIRKAKAEQLRSVAAMNNALAESTKAETEANAALAAIEIELQKALLDEEKARIAVSLAGQEQKLEAELLQAKANLLFAREQYLNALTTADQAEKQRLEDLLTAYTDAATELIGLKGNLASEKNTLIGLTYDLVSVETVKEQSIIGWKRDIAEQEAMIAAYEKYGSADKNEAQSAYLKADSEAKVLANAAIATSEKITVAGTDINNAYNLLDNSAYYNKLQDAFIYSGGYGGMNIYQATIDGVDYYVYDVTNLGITTQVPLFTEEITEHKDVEYVNDDQTAGGTESYLIIKDFYTVQTAGVKSYIAAYKEYIKENEQKDYDDAKKAYDDAVKAEADAKVLAEKDGATQAQKDDYVAKNLLTVAAKSVLDNATDELSDEQEKLAELEAAYTFLTSKEQTDAVKAWVDSYNALSKEICDLTIQYNKEDYVAGLKSAEASALNSIYMGAEDPANLILGCKSQIAGLEKQIVDMAGVITAEDAIEASKGEIAKLEAEIAAKEKEVATAKAALEAATNA